MPIYKVPSIHRFGIISHCQRLELQSRLLEDINEDKKVKKIKKNPFEISDEFVTSYNLKLNDTDKNTRMKNKELGNNMFFKIKRRIGLKSNCEGESQINLALGWTELSILAQCDGCLGDECLDYLIASLHCAPFIAECIPTLLYILETSMYFIHTVEISKEDLPSKHIRWLQIGEIVSLRLYIQQKTSMMKITDENLENLKVYIKTFMSYSEDFKNYPEVSIHFQIIENLVNYLINQSQLSIKSEQLKHDDTSLLWHAIDLWRCSYYSGLQYQLEESVIGIRTCLESKTYHYGSWLDCYVAIKIMSAAATFNKAALNIFVSLLEGIKEHVEGRKRKKDEKLETISFDGLLLIIIREFCEISLHSSNSIDKEQALSLLAQFVLHSYTPPIANPDISSEQKLILSRIYAVYELISEKITATGSSSFSSISNYDLLSTQDVINNALWSLISAIERRWRLNSDTMYEYSKIGKFLRHTITLSTGVDINSRISILLTDIFLPINFSSSYSTSEVSSQRPNSKVTNKGVIKRKSVNPKVIRQEISKQIISMKQAKYKEPKPSQYIEENEHKLKTITQYYWDQEYPEIVKKIDDLIFKEPEKEEEEGKEEEEKEEKLSESGN